MTSTIAPFQDAAGWERALYAFLAEKERRSGSRRTVEGYSRMLQHFFGAWAAIGQEDSLGLRQGPLGEGALRRHHRRPARLPELFLPLPDPDGDRRL
jgi:hypothetical protein